MPNRAQTEQKKSAIVSPELAAEPLKPLNFRVPASFHREFKVYASQSGISMVELLERSFRTYVGKKH